MTDHDRYITGGELLVILVVFCLPVYLAAGALAWRALRRAQRRLSWNVGLGLAGAYLAALGLTYLFAGELGRRSAGAPEPMAASLAFSLAYFFTLPAAAASAVSFLVAVRLLRRAPEAAT